MSRVRLRILASDLPGLVCGPHQGITVGLQVEQAVEGAVPGDSASAAWEAPIEVAKDADGWSFRGPAVHGKKGDKFLYLAWAERTVHGPMGFRRAKLMLQAVPSEVLDAACTIGTLTARLGLTDAKGMPRCAAVRPPVITWSADPT